MDPKWANNLSRFTKADIVEVWLQEALTHAAWVAAAAGTEFPFWDIRPIDQFQTDFDTHDRAALARKSTVAQKNQNIQYSEYTHMYVKHI